MTGKEKCPACGAGVGIACVCPARRDYNRFERELIRQGKEAEAKAFWHRRTGK